MKTPDEQIALSKIAVAHLLNAICDDPRKYWLLGNGTASWAKLTEAHAALYDIDVEAVRLDFAPDAQKYSEYRQQLKDDERLLEYCRENGITTKE